MLCKTKAIVLHSIKYGDSGLIVRAYSQDYGRESFIIQGVRKKRSKINPYLFEPFSILNIDLYYKQNQNIHRIKEVHSDVHLNRLHFDINRSTIATFLSEILIRTLPESEMNHALFNYLYNAIQILDIVESGLAYYHLLFLLQFSKFLGIHPENNSDITQYLVESGTQITDLFNYSLSDINQLKIDSRNRALLLDKIILYYRNHLEGLGELKSLTVLREVFH